MNFYMVVLYCNCIYLSNIIQFLHRMNKKYIGTLSIRINFEKKTCFIDKNTGRKFSKLFFFKNIFAECTAGTALPFKKNISWLLLKIGKVVFKKNSTIRNCKSDLLTTCTGHSGLHSHGSYLPILILRGYISFIKY